MTNVIWATYKKNRIGIIRAVPWSFMISRILTGITQIIFPFLMYTYFAQGIMGEEFYVYSGSADYLTYVVLGSALNVLAVSTLMNVGRALITELREGTLEMLLLSPASRKQYFLGCLLEQTMRAVLEFGTVLIVGGFLGANVEGIFRIETWLVIIVAVFSFFSLGLTLSGIMLYTRDTYITQNTLFEIMTLVCGIMYPIQYLPKYLQVFAQIFPLTPAVELFRNVVLKNQHISENKNLLLQISIFTIIYMVIGIYWNQKMERKILENVFE